MLFKTNSNLKDVSSFDPVKCRMAKEKTQTFDKDEIPMGCCEGCWSGCVGGPHR